MNKQFEIGDFLKYRRYRGVVTELTRPTKSVAGYYTIKLKNGDFFTDYHYVFEEDLESKREHRLNLLLKEKRELN